MKYDGLSHFPPFPNQRHKAAELGRLWLEVTHILLGGIAVGRILR